MVSTSMPLPPLVGAEEGRDIEAERLMAPLEHSVPPPTPPPPEVASIASLETSSCCKVWNKV